MVKVCELGFLNALRDVKVLRMIMDLKKNGKLKEIVNEFLVT